MLRGKWTKELRCYPVEKGADEISALDLSGDFDETKEATGGFSVLWKASPKPPEAEQVFPFNRNHSNNIIRSFFL